MVWDDIHGAIPLGFLLSFMIGPVFFVLLETSATRGFRAGLALDMGVILADILFLTIAYFSSFQLLENLSNQPGLYVFGGAILLVYGLTIVFRSDFKAKSPRIETRGSDYLGLFVKGFLLNFIPNIGPTIATVLPLPIVALSGTHTASAVLARSCCIGVCWAFVTTPDVFAEATTNFILWCLTNVRHVKNFLIYNLI